jgi:AcrR family transcriptional regulator
MARRSPRSSAEVRELVLQAATTLFAERGYARVATRDIARSADVTPSQLFAHFGTKARLFVNAIVEPYVQILSGISERWQADPVPADSIEAFNRTVLTELFEVNNARPGLMTALIIAQAHEESLVEEIAPSLEPVDAALRPLEQLVRPDPADPDAPVLSVRLTHGTVNAATQFHDWLAGHLGDRASAIDAMTEILTYGLNAVPDEPVHPSPADAEPAGEDAAPVADGMRPRLIAAAAELFAQRGYPGVSTRAIATAAGTSETILFRHFPTKHALFEQSVSRPWAEAAEEFLRRTGDLGLTALIVELYHLFHDHRPVLIALLEFERQESDPSSNTVTPGTMAALLDRLQGRLPPGRPGAAVPPSAIAGVIVAAILGAAVLDVWLFTGHPPESDLVVRALIDLVYSGVSAR